MVDWTEGYVADIDYTYGYYAELSPQQLCLLASKQGLAKPAEWAQFI